MLRSADDYLGHPPSVDAVLRDTSIGPLIEECGRDVVVGWIRVAIAELRERRATETIEGTSAVLKGVNRKAEEFRLLRLRNVVNATSASGSQRSGTPTLWRIPIDGGEPAQLTTSNSWLPAVSPDGKYIACFGYFGSASRRLLVIPFIGGQPLKSFPIPETALLGRQRILWSPDGKSIFYRAAEQGLLQQGLDQAGPQHVSGFDALPLHNFAWSFDGKNLAFASGPAVQEIILIESSK